MNRKLLVVKDLLTILLNYTVVFALQLIILSFTGEEYNLWMLLLPAAIPVYFYILGRLVKEIPIFIFMHILPFAVLFFTPSWQLKEKAVFSLVTVFYIGISIWEKIVNRISLFYVAVPITFLAAAYFVTVKQEMWNSSEFIVMVMLWSIVLYYLRYYLERLELFVKMRSESGESIPVRKMLISGGIMVGIYTSMVFIILFAGSHLEWISRINRFAIRMIRQFLSLLVSHINFESTEPIIESPVLEAAAGNTAGNSSGEWILQLIFLLINAAVITAIIWLAYKLDRLILSLLKTNKTNKHDENKYREDEIVRLNTSTKKKEGKLPLFSFRPDDKIRKIYYIFVENQSRKTENEIIQKLKKCTPRECADILELDEENRKYVLVLAGLYEKARYAKESCDGKDVKRARECMRNISLKQERFKY